MPAGNEALDSAASWTAHYRSGQSIFNEGDPSRNMYRIEKGCVRLQLNGSEGARQIVTFLFEGDLFGYEVEQRFCAAEATCDTDLTCWSVRSVLKLGVRSPDVIVTLMATSEARFGELARHFQQITHLPVKDRVIWFFSGLLRCRGLPKAGNRIHLPMNRRDIADYLGVAPETLSRAITELESAGYFHRHGRSDFVLDAHAFGFFVRSHADLIIYPQSRHTG